MAVVEYRVLGPLEALVGGRPAALGAPRQRALLALLLTQPNRVVSTSRLIDTLWGEEPPASEANLVQRPSPAAQGARPRGDRHPRRGLRRAGGGPCA